MVSAYGNLSNIFSRMPSLWSLVCSWQSHVSVAPQKPGVLGLALISPGCTSELSAVECQRNGVPNVTEPCGPGRATLGCLSALGPFPIPSFLFCIWPLRVLLSVQSKNSRDEGMH